MDEIIEEATDHEALLPQWKQLMANLDRGDELVISKFSNAVRGSRELSTLIEYCRVKVVRIVSINDKIDSKGIIFPETTAAQVLEIVGALPEEVIALRRASAHQIQLQKSIKVQAAFKVRAETNVKRPLLPCITTDTLLMTFGISADSVVRVRYSVS